MLRLKSIFLLAFFAVCGCSSSENDNTPKDSLYRGYHAQTILMGQSDNSEVIKVLPAKRLAVLIASKTRKVTLLKINEDDSIQELRSRILFENDPTESELTHIDFNSNGTFAAITRTIIETDGDTQTNCRGEIVFVGVEDTDSFGDILAQVEVGPMPDSVDISSDDQYVVSANERDKVDLYGKCAVSGLDPSISIISLSDGPQSAVEQKRIILSGKDDTREPEAIIMSQDSDLAMTVLQDSQEVVMFRISEIQNIANPTSNDVQIITLPDNSLGDHPWPDGIVNFETVDGNEYFAVAGEYNDTIMILDSSGNLVEQIEIDSSDFPANFPRDLGSSAPFRPDSVCSFWYGQESYLALSLKHAGAVGVWKASQIDAIKFASAVKVGHDDPSPADQASEIGTEGISASSTFGFIVTANEGESSVSLVVPEE
jgi:hypothetical protein